MCLYEAAPYSTVADDIFEVERHLQGHFYHSLIAQTLFDGILRKLSQQLIPHFGIVVVRIA